MNVIGKTIHIRKRCESTVKRLSWSESCLMLRRSCNLENHQKTNPCWYDESNLNSAMKTSNCGSDEYRHVC